ncbi:MAG: hypothetical protein AABY22_09855 [Nanoarchaeota archaeon]
MKKNKERRCSFCSVLLKDGDKIFGYDDQEDYCENCKIKFESGRETEDE